MIDMNVVLKIIAILGAVLSGVMAMYCFLKAAQYKRLAKPADQISKRHQKMIDELAKAKISLILNYICYYQTKRYNWCMYKNEAYMSHLVPKYPAMSINGVTGLELSDKEKKAQDLIWEIKPEEGGLINDRMRQMLESNNLLLLRETSKRSLEQTKQIEDLKEEMKALQKAWNDVHQRLAILETPPAKYSGKRR